ncbi:hypothetical protein [Paraburkholderia caribensis]|uniref:hypothetical protein n=1 Tax=Paraburkholderia caribensis TaxID=75105 RepID=UPI0007204670|nr:hypothetical protein [Paraburkholderia caribensis]ALP67101.1 hypothetical protein AN416_30825 [Paraburkholderia caribensis]AMV47678.1 hypothetical protein ATN79_44210 [Paraburkholderia caribensis]AUT56807.1 hypothetical protein C2L66_33775 [Paraburkholderia caribensis]
MTNIDIGRLFRSKLAGTKPLVAPFLLEKADSTCSSYFLDVFEPDPIVVEKDMIDSLVAIWREQGLEELALFEPELRKIAKALRAPDEQAEAISQFVYVMY